MTIIILIIKKCFCYLLLLFNNNKKELRRNVNVWYKVKAVVYVVDIVGATGELTFFVVLKFRLVNVILVYNYINYFSHYIKRKLDSSSLSDHI